MTQTQFLLLLVAALPLLNCLLLHFFADSSGLVNFISKLFPIIFLTTLIGILGSIKYDNNSLTIFKAAPEISLSFAVNHLALGFLFLLNFIWIIFTYYSYQFIKVTNGKYGEDFKMFFALIIALLNLIIISKNLVSILFFYSCLIMSCHFFAVKFLSKKDDKFAKFFTALLYLESAFFFLAIVATYKFAGKIDFSNGGILAEIADHKSEKYLIILLLYLLGLFFSVLLPLYLFYRNINFDPLVIYVLFLLAYAFSSIYIFIKLLFFIFGIKIFALVLSKSVFIALEWVLLINMAISCAMLLWNKNLKSLFFYLFFSQFVFMLFAMFIFALYDPQKLYLAPFSFILSLTLIFLALSNIILYINKAEKKSIEGLFYDLRVSSSLLLFSIMNIIGFAPAIGALQTFFLIKIFFQKGLGMAAIIFGLNFLTLIFFACRLFYPMSARSEEVLEAVEKSPEISSDQENSKKIAREIDFDSSLILTGLVVAIAMFLLLILFLPITNFFNA